MGAAPVLTEAWESSPPFWEAPAALDSGEWPSQNIQTDARNAGCVL